MSNQVITTLNKKATNYSVERKAIERCVTEGYVFTSEKIQFDVVHSTNLAVALMQQQIVQSVEIYCADQNNRFALKKIRVGVNETEVAMYNDEYSFTDYFTVSDFSAKRAVIKVTTFDMPLKHLRRISKHRNGFMELINYLVTIPIEPLTQISSIYDENEKFNDLDRLPFINCDQYEYRIRHLLLDDRYSDCFEFEAVIGRGNIPEYVKRIEQNMCKKIQAISYVDPFTHETVNCASNSLTDDHPVLWKWMYEDIRTRDRDSIYDINEDHASMIVRLTSKDLKVLQNIKTASEALQYLVQ